MSYFLITLLVSFAVAIWIIVSARDEDHWALDTSIGPQKVHTTAVPRVGGLAIFVAMAAAVLVMWWQGPGLLRNAAALMLCATPAFAVGLLEDMTKRVNPTTRLIAICLSAIMAWITLDVTIMRVGVPMIDELLRHSWLAVPLTVFAVAGISNSINLIDGLHGLAVLTSALIFTAIGIVAYAVGDELVLGLALAGCGAVLGLFALNYPHGRIFLGDGGAYFVGFMLAQCGIMLFQRNAEVSPWFAVLALAYPATETVYSMYRRRFVRKSSPMHPDRSHLHSLIFGRVVPRFAADGSIVDGDARNARTSPYLWALTMLTLVPAVVFYDNALGLIASLFIFVSVYIAIYARLVRFKPVHLPFGRARKLVSSAAR